MNGKSFLIFLLCTSCALCSAQNKTVQFNSPDISYEGRILFRDDAAMLSWSGSSVSILFEGESVSAILKDLDTADYYNVIVDEKVILRFHADTLKRSYTLASNLPAGKHRIELFKRTEWDKGQTLFYGFTMPENASILPSSSVKKRKIEFYGNSITCGYALEDSSGKDSPNGYFENNYLSYAAITARHFNAQYSCISKSGIGIMVSWFPFIMPDIYDRLDPTDPKSTWNFADFTPDIVVINLFQNDSWIVEMPEYEQFIKTFGTKKPDEKFIVNAYKDFVSAIRAKYPNASIICALGNMDATRDGSPWPGYIQEAVRQLSDRKMYTQFFEYKNSDGHPHAADQKAMADRLIDFINKNIAW
jgi:hypothetical protein